MVVRVGLSVCVSAYLLVCACPYMCTSNVGACVCVFVCESVRARAWYALLYKKVNTHVVAMPSYAYDCI